MQSPVRPGRRGSADTENWTDDVLNGDGLATSTRQMLDPIHLVDRTELTRKEALLIFPHRLRSCREKLEASTAGAAVGFRPPLSAGGSTDVRDAVFCATASWGRFRLRSPR